MEDPGEGWEIQEHSLSEETKSNASWILEKGMNLGKKIVITGIVISSAPLVLPPLVVISVIGFAFSVPSGLLLSSYVCTEKLMSKLLSRPSGTIFVEEEEGFDDRDEMGEETEQMGNEYWEKGIEGDDQKLVGKRDESSKEEGNDEEVGEHLDIGNEEKTLIERTKADQPSDLVHQTVLSFGGEEKNGVHVSITEDVHLENREVGESESDQKVTTSEELLDEGTRSYEGSKVNKEIQERGNEEMKAEGNRDEENSGNAVLVEKAIGHANGSSKKSAKKRKGNKKQNAGLVQEELRKERDKEKVVHSNAEAREIVEKNPEESSADHTLPEVKVPEFKRNVLAEGKIRAWLDALRTIVGYKAAPHTSCIEEVKALYIFTGVEPPASFKDPSDLVEVCEKLEFLMSIVGVK